MSYTTSSIQQIPKFADSKAMISALGKPCRIGSYEMILSVETIENLGAAEHLMIRLPDMVAGSLSLNSLQEEGES